MALNDLYSENLARFKQHEKPEAVLIIADNPKLIGIAVAWGNLDIHCADTLTEIQSESEHRIWEWLWENTEFSFAELKIKACLSCHESVVPELLAPLIGNRVIYPDGTVNSYVQCYLKERVSSLFQNVKKGVVAKINGGSL
jgi:hypothetical protein